MTERNKMWFTLFPAIIAFVGVLVGAVITTGAIYLLAVRKETADAANDAGKWRRDRCLEAYTDVLRACDVVFSEAAAAYGIKCATPGHLKQAEIVIEMVAEMYRAAGRAYLLGPQEIHQPLNELVIFFGKDLCGKASALMRPSEDTWRHIVNRYSHLYTTFRHEARNDLGVHQPLHTMNELSRRVNRTR
jgi:hypothetical protein